MACTMHLSCTRLQCTHQISGTWISPVSASTIRWVSISTGTFGSKEMCRSQVSPAEMYLERRGSRTCQDSWNQTSKARELVCARQRYIRGALGRAPAGAEAAVLVVGAPWELVLDVEEVAYVVGQRPQLEGVESIAHVCHPDRLLVDFAHFEIPEDDLVPALGKLKDPRMSMSVPKSMRSERF